MYYFWLSLLVLGLGLGWCLTLFGLPGNWVMVALAGLFAYLFPPTAAQGLGWKSVLAGFMLAILGELAELFAGAAGATRGGSRRGALCAIAGSFVGGLVGTFLGIPIPLVGAPLGAVLFACMGAMIGAIAGELSLGVPVHQSFSIGKAAFWGRLWGTGAKLIAGLLIALVVLLGALI